MSVEYSLGELNGKRKQDLPPNPWQHHAVAAAAQQEKYKALLLLLQPLLSNSCLSMYFYNAHVVVLTINL